MTLYLFGTRKDRRSLRAIYDYSEDHLRTWFPQLPSYGGFLERLNRLGSAFAQLGDDLLRLIATDRPQQQAWPSYAPAIALVDALPIIMARHGRSDTAAVAREVSDKGYCAAFLLAFNP